MAQDVVGLTTKQGNVEALTELLAGLVGTDATLHLFKSSFSPTPNSVEADFLAEEADFSGYAAVPITYGAVGLDFAGQGYALADRVEFQNTTGIVGNSIGGAWVSVESSPGPPAVNKAMTYYKLPIPISMAAALQTMGVVVVANSPDLSGKAIFDN